LKEVKIRMEYRRAGDGPAVPDYIPDIVMAMDQ